MNLDYKEIYAKIKPAMKEIIETAVFVIVMVIIIRYFIGKTESVFAIFLMTIKSKQKSIFTFILKKGRILFPSSL